MVKIAVIGGSQCDQETYDQAFQVGSEIAKRDAVLFCGGLSGVMEAAAKGAKSENGVTIGILPTLKTSDANPYIDYPICTGIGHARNLGVAASADAVIAIDGYYGTLSEIAFARTLGKPVISLHSWQIDATIQTASTPTAAVDAAFSSLHTHTGDLS